MVNGLEIIGIIACCVVCVFSIIGMISNVWKYRAVKSRPIVPGQFWYRKWNSVGIEWKHRGHVYTGSVHHPLFFLARGFSIRVNGYGDKVTPDYWFTNGLGSILLSAFCLAVGMGGALLIFLEL